MATDANDASCVVSHCQPSSPCGSEHGKMGPVTDIDSSQAVVCRVGHLGVHYWDWLRRPDSCQPRFFRSPLLEACSKTPWWVVPLLWLPFFTACFVHSWQHLGVAVEGVVAWLLVGTVAWQLLEYLIHRFIFHAKFESYWGITFHFLFHGCHHKYPMDPLRLVFPPVPASAVMAVVYVTLHALLLRHQALPLFAGMGYGYVAYDCLHYFLHHHGPSLPGAMLQDLRQRHMHHHYKNSCTGYGISSVLFDVVLRTSK